MPGRSRSCCPKRRRPQRPGWWPSALAGTRSGPGKSGRAARPPMLRFRSWLSNEKLLPETATAAEAGLVAQRSRGNPFWAREIWASRQAADAPVPQLALERSERLRRLLSPPAREAMATVAAAGRIAVSDTVALLSHLEDPAAAVDEAVLADFLVETDGRLAAAHPLIGAAALDVMPPGRRAQLYRRLAAASASAERHAHFAALAAGPGPDPQVADALDAAAAAAHARTANDAAAEFAVQAVTFTPESDAAAAVRRRIHAGELLFLAGDIDGSLAHLEALDTTSLDTADLERALPLLVDMVDLRRGPAAATAIVTSAIDAAGDDPRRRALVLALASDPEYGIRGKRRVAAVEAIGCAETRALTRNCWSVPSASKQSCRPPRCTTPRICTGGSGRVTPRTWTSRGRRCSGASPGPGT